MKRRFNYTERKRITLDTISIKVNKKDDISESFDAIIKLDGLGLPAEGKLYVEVYHRTDLKRYSFGAVGNVTHPVDTSLSELANHEDLRFRVMVVDESEKQGLILALADRIRPSGVYRKRSILPVDFRDLGRQVWKVDYNGDEPVLVLNDRIPNIHNLARMDPRFHLYVYPAVIRDIFIHMFFIDKIDDFNEPSPDWCKDWLEFARRFLTEEKWLQLQLGEESDPVDTVKWIDELMEEFCLSRSKEWSKLLDLEEVG